MRIVNQSKVVTHKHVKLDDTKKGDKEIYATYHKRYPSRSSSVIGLARSAYHSARSRGLAFRVRCPYLGVAKV